MAEVVVFFECFDEGDDEVDGGVDVVQVGGFDGGVHVAQRHGDVGAGYAVVGAEDGVRIGARGATAGFVLEGDVVFVGGKFDARVDLRVASRAVAEACTFTEFDVAVAAFVEAGGVGGVGDVEADGGIRVDAVGEHLCADAADFFLDGVAEDDVPRGFDFVFLEFAGYFGEDEAAEAVVKGAADEAFAVHEHGAVAIDADVADAEAEFFDFFTGAGSEVDVEFPEFGGFAVVVADVDGSVAGDADDFAFGSHEADAAATGDGDVAAAEAFDAEVAVIGDVADAEADFIGMGVEEEGFGVFAFGFECGPGVAVGVAFDGIGEFFHLGGPKALGVHFMPGRAGCFEDFREEVK